MKQCISWVTAFMTVLVCIIAAQAGTYTSDFDQYLSENQSKDMVSAIITMSDRVDLDALKAELYARKADRQEWHETVVRALQEKATESQPNFLAKLDEMKKAGRVSSYKNLWLGNLVIVTATTDVYDELVKRTDVDQIAPNYVIESIKDIESGDTPTITSGVESGLTAIHADECWAMGYTGEGRLVSHLDTGVAGDHEALVGNWRGLDSRYADNPEWAWYDPVTETTFPFDSGYHGTHTMGTICGLGENDGDTIGVAFGAEWISAGVIDRVDLDQTVEDAVIALQWLTDPDGDPSTVWDVPDVCSNSWGISPILHGVDECDETLWDAIDDAEAAGIVVVFAAGNEGSYGSESLRTPADRATTNLNCFAVGAVDGNEEDLPIASFSSRGPSYCTNDGSETIKPEICAPGVDVRSAYASGGYTTLSGTSMAAPHIAGVVALIRQANPNLSSDQVKQILFNTAVDLGDEGEDNNYGMGVVDAYEAVQLALSYLGSWGTLAGVITDQATGNPIAGATISVVDRSYSATSRSNGMYYLYMPADTSFDITVDYSPTHLPYYDTQSVNVNETTYVNYALEGKVTATFTVSFGNGSEINYRNFYMKGSWDNDGFYDADWSGDLVTLTDDGQSPDEIAGDGVFTGQVQLASDDENTYSWKVYTENYGVNNIDDAFLTNGSDFSITGLDPVSVPTLVPDPTGSDNNFHFSVSGDNALSLDLVSNYDGYAYKWGAAVYLNEGTTYTFAFHVMGGDEAIYGSGGVGGAELTYTPTYNGTYNFIFNDDNDSYIVQLTGTDGVPMYPGATSGQDGHIPISWMIPGSNSSYELAYDDGTLVNAWVLYDSNNLIAVMFAPESYPVVIDSVMVHVLTEGDAYWPSFDSENDPIGVSVYLDDGAGIPEDDPVFYTEGTCELGDWFRADVDQIVVSSGYFWVTMNSVDGENYDYVGLDATTDYPANQWYKMDGTWYSGGYYTGDQMIRAKVFSNDASTWLAYDGATPAEEITAPVFRGNIGDRGVGTISAPEAVPAISNPILPDMMAYHPMIMSNPSLIAETQVLAGYYLYRSTSFCPYDQGLRITSDMLTTDSYDDWGTDAYGPIVNGTTYHYQASAIYEVDGSYVEVGPSEEFTGTPANHAPDAPANLTGSVSDHTVTLVWDANTDYDIAAYNIYRRDYNASEFNLVGTVAHPSVTYIEDIATVGIYRYKIKAVDTGGMESDDFSNKKDIAIGAIPPGTITASTDQEFQIELSWDAPGSSSLLTEAENVNVAVVTGDFENSENTILQYLISNGVVDEYTYFNAMYSTPSLSDLEDFDMVIVWSYVMFYDGAGLGDVLAEYAELEKPILAFSFSNCDYSMGLSGDFMNYYSPLSLGNPVYTTTNLGEYDSSSPYMDGVSALSDFYSIASSAQNNATVPAYWDNGYPLIAISSEYPIAFINAFVGTGNMWTGDMLQLIYNTVANLNTPGIGPDGYKLYKSESESGPFAELGTLGSDINEYIDSPVPNAIPYYYQVTAIWNNVESDPSNTAEGMAQNCAPEVPTNLTASVNDHTVSLTWTFTDLMGDFGYYNVYRKIYGDAAFVYIGTTTTESYTDEVTGEDAVYLYCVTAVDNGDPQLESSYSHYALAPIGTLPPNFLNAASNKNGIVPLSWSAPGAMPCTTLVFDDGSAVSSFYYSDLSSLIAKQFVGSAPVTICTLYVHVLTEGDSFWPFPNGTHAPINIQVWDDDGTGQPGSVLYETEATCELGQWITVGLETPITCNTNNFWISWANTTASDYDAMGMDISADYPDYNWYRTNSVWTKNNSTGDHMIRASITIDGVAELLTENNPVSKFATSDLPNDDSQLYDTEEMLGYYIYRSTSSDVPIDDEYRITDSYVTGLRYDDETVVNGTTYYYICVAVYNTNGEIEYSTASNEVSATPINPGQLEVNPTSIEAVGTAGGDEVFEPFTLNNSGGLPVTFSTGFSFDDRIAKSVGTTANYRVDSKFSVVSATYDKSDDEPEVSNPPVVASEGGPDDFGYTWIDSDEPDGPIYNWVDITSIGEQIYGLYLDENIGPYSIGFDFPFYGTTYSTFRMCANGWFSFTSSETSYENSELPNSNGPFNMFAPFWDDLMPVFGQVYYYSNSEDSMVVSFVGVYNSSYSAISFQIILTSNGNMTFQYDNMGDDGSSATIGIQNGDGSYGLTVSHNSSYVHDELAILFIGGWLSTSYSSGTIAAGGSVTIDAICNPSNLESGNYYGILTFTGYDANQDIDPISLDVTFLIDPVSIEDDETISLPTVFSLDQNYPNPFNAHTEIKYALPVDSDVQLEIYNVLGQKVTTLVDEQQAAGYHSLIWDGTNESGQVVSSGMYLYKLVTNEDTFVKKMVMLK